MPTARLRPLIGLTSYRQTTAWWSWERDAALVPGSYLDMVETAGGQPLLIPPPGAAGGGGHRDSGPTDRLGRLLTALDGLILTGGGDIDAHCYGRRPDARNAGTNPNRDALEIALAHEALRRDLPLLAICRGLQVLNVALGGDLVQHLPGALGPIHQPQPGEFGPVQVTTEPSSTVRRLFGDRAEVLCSHHQAIATVAPGLVVTAKSADGVVEAVEMPDHRFVVGVQWHPEEGGDVRLFDALVAAARSGTDPPVIAGARS